jgi:RHS repeat-associated protein
MNRVSGISENLGGDTSHWGEQYSYDNWGNMTQLSLTQGSGNAFSVTANNANQLSNLTYDLSGNVTQDQFGNTTTYNAESRVASASSSSGSATYTYDGDGNRVIKTNSAGTTLYWPSPVTGILDESNSTATAFAPQIYLGGLKVWSSDTAGSGRFLFQDHLGSTRVTANASGSVLDDIDYRSFGNPVANYGTNQSDNHYLFTGYESDAADTSTDYATYRNQSYALGRFTRPDPYLGSYDQTNPQSFNRYTYTLNNPLAWTDPTGLDYIDENGNLCYDPTDPNDLSIGAVVCEGYGLIFGTQYMVIGGGGGGGGGAPSKMTPYPFPATAVKCTTSTGVSFYAPPGFSVDNIAAKEPLRRWLKLG